MARPLRKKWACTNCGKVGDHGRRCVGIDKFYDQPQCKQCRSRYAKERANRSHISFEETLESCRKMYSGLFPNDKAWNKRSWNFMAAKMERKGVKVHRIELQKGILTTA